MGKFNLKLFIKRKILRNKETSDDVLKRLRKGGADIGEDVLIYSTSKTMIDGSSPYLLKIGNHVRIAEGVKILTHDYSWSVLKRWSSDEISPGVILGAQSPVEIGNCVFIGMNAVITRGVTIGDHVVIGTGSIVTKDCPSNGVYAGNPAKRIMSIEEYRRKREALQFDEAKDIAIRYRRRMGKNPPIEVFSEYFPLFCTADAAREVPVFLKQMGRMGNLEDTVRYMQTHPPRFPGYAAFLEACYGDGEAETGSGENGK